MHEGLVAHGAGGRAVVQHQQVRRPGPEQGQGRLEARHPAHGQAPRAQQGPGRDRFLGIHPQNAPGECLRARHESSFRGQSPACPSTSSAPIRFEKQKPGTLMPGARPQGIAGPGTVLTGAPGVLERGTARRRKASLKKGSGNRDAPPDPAASARPARAGRRRSDLAPTGRRGLDSGPRRQDCDARLEGRQIRRATGRGQVFGGAPQRLVARRAHDLRPRRTAKAVGRAVRPTQ